MINVGSDFSGVGAFNQALIRLGIPYNEVFACDMDKYARQTFIHNYGEPDYYPENVYDRKIPSESLDIYMTSPPCQAFSLAGKRKGKEDLRGVLFFNSHEFIQVNKPRFFIFENVKGLLSSTNGLQFENILYLCFYNFKKINQWQNLNTQTSNLNLLSQTLAPYLFMNWSKKLGLKKTKSGMSFISNSVLSYEKLEKVAGNGLKRRLKFLEERIYQITKKSNYYQTEKIVQFGCKEEDLVLPQEKLYLIKNLYPTAINILEKTVDINVNTLLFANPLLEDNSKNGKLYTTLMELNSTTDPRIFLYVIEMNIIRLTILALDLSSNLWKEIWLILIGKKEFTGLKTFDEWLFNLDHLNYHIYWKVLNAKKLGVPQNRERVFIIGIRDDEDNVFNWPNEVHLTKKLKDVLEPEVDEKYFLSEKMMDYLVNRSDNFNAGKINYKTENDSASCLTKSSSSIDISDNIIVVGNTNPSGHGQNGNIYDEEGLAPTLSTNKGEGIKVKSATQKGFELATENDSINFSVLNSKTRRGRVGKEVAQKLDTACNQGICIPVLTPDRVEKRQNGRRFKDDGEEMFTITTQDRHGIYDGFKIRRLTPRECFRLMDFPDTFTWNVSDSQAYKQAGNSIVVKMLELIISKFKL
jgi:DNA (cytosine-5)-methyltransferase 1